MIIIDDVEDFRRQVKDGALANIKFYCISDKWYAVDIGELTKCKYFKTSVRLELPITRSLLLSFPAPRQPVNYVTVKLLRDQPVIMFEDAGFDKVYFRADGRHRIQGAVELGLKSVPAVFIPRRIWGLFIVGGIVDPDINIDIATDETIWNNSVPLTWDRPPNAGPSIGGYHYEPTFVLKDPENKAEPPKQEFYLSNAATSRVFKKPDQPRQDIDKPRTAKVDLFASNAGIAKFI